ncbi:hypothetical protein HYFRA_00009784 [Hymenoscyphus fraxineus]|uniref:Uncharacterized protein n=1 Tax=Hymenoscyphus fraxineus TaxID=746836 RepID=A0A9N9L670_9HELO|nr:hypothetical protein HYFRA_00009784 [Hymenoscyphus fraxineus]
MAPGSRYRMRAAQGQLCEHHEPEDVPTGTKTETPSPSTPQIGLPLSQLAPTKPEMAGGVRSQRATEAEVNPKKTGIGAEIYATQASPSVERKSGPGHQKAETDHHRGSTRPEKTDFVARQMISSALGIKVGHKKDEKTLAVKKALRMNKRADRLSTWDDFLSKQDKNTNEPSS